jgi:hypothetical protein
MNYIKFKSHRGLVNLFADYIVKQINTTGQYDTTLDVTYCGKFFVVNGFTNREELIDMSQIKVKFMTEYTDYLNEFDIDNMNIIDLITYGVELEKKDEMWFKFYPSSRILYPQEVIDFDLNIPFHSISPDIVIELDYSQPGLSNYHFVYSPLNVTSSFPHGYSLTMGRDLLYYSEYICSHLNHNFRTGTINFKMSLKQNDDEDYNISISTESVYKDSDLKSLILDVFDFNITKFRTSVKNYDITEDLTNPFVVKPWVTKDKMSEMFLF